MIIYDDRARSGAGAGNGSGGFFDSAVAALRGVLKSREGHAFNLDFRLRPYGRAAPRPRRFPPSSTTIAPGGRPGGMSGRP